MTTNIQCLCIDASKQLLSENIPKGCCFFLSALLRPVECGAYSSGVSRKEKEIETQRSRSVAIAALARR